MAVFGSSFVAWLLLALCLLATTIGWVISRAHLEEREEEQFRRRVRLTAGEIRERLRDCEQALQSARSYFAGSGSVSREEWRRYVTSLDLRHLYPVVAGLGYAAYVPRPEVDSFLQAARADGASDFSIHPPGTNADCFVVKYLEPGGPDLGLPGYDLGSDRACRAAAERARDTALVTVTPADQPVHVLEDQPEMLILSPVYRRGARMGTTEERRAALQGWVYAPFCLTDVMQTILGAHEEDLDFDIFGGPKVSKGTLLYDDDGVPQALDPKLHGRLSDSVVINIGGQSWTLFVTSRPSFDAAADRSQPWFILGGGLCISFLAFFATRSLATTRQRAVVLAERITAKSRLQERAIVASNVGIVITDANQPDNPIIYVNPAMERITGYAAAEMLGRNCRFLQGSDSSQPGLIQLRSALRDGRSCCVTLYNRHKDGTGFWNELSISPVRDDQGRLTHFVGLAEDITARKRAEQALRDAKEAAEAANRAKSQFLASMSHEIRTPMNGIIGLTNLVLDSPLTSDQRGYLNAVRNSAEDLLRIINDILDFSRIEAGKLQLQSGSFALRETLDGSLTTLRMRAREKSLDLSLTVGREVPDRLVGDEGRLRQILVNLVGNAIKFTERGSVSVTVALTGSETLLRHRDEDDRPSAKANAALCGLHFCIIDTGIGIASDKQGVIFDAFTQADTSITRKYGGTGLGLTIASRLTQLLNGHIWVESEPGRGSRFHFTVVFTVDTRPEPSVADFGRDREAGTKVLAAKTGPARVLLAEDNPVNREVAEATLKRLGHRVETASNGQEVLAALDRDCFDLVLMDLQMPEMDGFEAAALIRRKEQGTGCHMPIIALTAHALEGDRERCLAAGMDDYLAKPLRRRDLTRALERWLPAPPPTVTAKQPAPSPEPAFDRSRFLQEVEQNTALVRRMASLYFEHAPQLRDHIRASVRAGDWSAVEKPLHKLKGSLSQFAATHAVACTQRLEDAARHRDPERAASLSAQLETELNRFDAELRHFLHEL